MSNRKVIIATLVAALVCVGIYFYKANRVVETTEAEGWEENWSENWVAPKTPEAPKADAPKIESPRPINSYADAIKEAKNSKRLVFLYFHANWCGNCKEMERTTLSSPEVKAALKDYIVIMIDSDRETEVVKKYRVGVLPTYLVVNGDEKVMNKGYGKKNVKSFVRWLQKD